VITMAESYVQVDEGTGKKLRTIEKTVGVNVVHEEVIVVNNGTIDVDNTVNVTFNGGTLDEITNIPSTLSIDLKVDSVGLLKPGQTINVDQESSVEIYGTDIDIRDITETIPTNLVTDSVGLLKPGNTVQVTQESSVEVYSTNLDIRDIIETIPVAVDSGTVEISGTLPVSAIDLDIRDITETIPVRIDGGTLAEITNTIPVWEQGKITYSTIPISSITFDYVGGTLSTLNFFNINGTEEFELQFNYSGSTLTSIERS